MAVNMADPRPPFDPSGPSYSGGGIKTSVAGTVYQIELLILLMNRGLRAGCRFNVATEVASAGTFDDLVFVYETDTTNGVLFLQAKHRTNANNKIRDIDLTEVVNGDFYVPKYFESYRKINKKGKEFKGDIKHFVIYTPINIDDDILHNFEEVHPSHIFAENGFLWFDSALLPDRKPENHPKFLKISKESKSEEEEKTKKDFYKNIVQLLRNNTERLIVAEKLGKMIARNNAITVEEVLNKHRDWLLEKVFDGDNKTTKNKKVYIRFKESFLKNTETEEIKELSEFRKVLLQSYSETRYIKDTKKENDRKDEVSERKNIIDVLIKDNENIEVPEIFLTSKYKKLQLKDTTMEEIEPFLDKFVFATNQPNNDELKKIIQKEIGEMMNFVLDDSQWVESRLQACVLDWLRAEKAHYVTNENCEAFFEYVKQKRVIWSLTGLSLQNVSQIEKFGYIFSTGNLIGSLNDFFAGEDDQNILCIYYTNKLLTQIKLCQIAHFIKDNNLDFVFGELKKLSSQVGTKLCPKKAFTSHLINHIFIEIDNCSNLSPVEKELMQHIMEVAKTDTKKRLVVMVAKDQQTPLEKVMLNCSNKTVYDSENNFIDLSENSKEKLLNTATVKFQGKHFNLAALLDTTCMGFLGGDTLCELINDNLDLGSAAANKLYDSVKAYYIERRFSYRIEIQELLHERKYMTLMEVILQNNHDKIKIVNAAPGMGKSTVLSRLEANINLNHPEYFCIRTNLVDHCQFFEELGEDDMTKKSIEFLYKISRLASKGSEDNICEQFILLDNGDLKLNASSRATFDELLRISIFCHEYNGGNIILLLDAFDEISPLYNTTVAGLIQTLKDTKVSKIMITSRPYDVVSELEDTLNSYPYTLEPLSVEEQRDLLLRYWTAKLQNTETKFCMTEVIEFLDLLKRTIFKHLQQHNDGYMSTFMSIPLHVFMLATVEEKRFKEFLAKKDSVNFDYETTHFSIYTMYYEFFKTKFYDILHSETDVRVPKNNRMLKEELKKTMEAHGKMALLELFANVPKSLVSEDDRKELKEAVMAGDEKTGFAHIVNGELRFVHGTYAEFFAAYLLANVILDSKGSKSEAEQFLYKIITQHSWKSSVVFAFFNYKVVSNSKYCSLFNYALNGYVQQVMGVENAADIKDNLGRTPFHLLFCSGLVCEEVINIYTSHRSFMFLPDKLFNWSPVHYAVLYHRCNQTFPSSRHQFVTKSPESQLRDINGRSPLILATLGQCKRFCVFNYIYDFSLEIDAQDNTGKTALHYAVINRKELAFVCIVHLRADLDVQDNEGKTALHYAIEKQRLDAANNLVIMGAEVTKWDNNKRIPAYFDMSKVLNGELCSTLRFINKLEPVVMKFLVENSQLSQAFDPKILKRYKNIYRYVENRNRPKNELPILREMNRYKGLFLKNYDSNVTINDRDPGTVEITLTKSLNEIVESYKLWKHSKMKQTRKYTRF